MSAEEVVVVATVQVRPGTEDEALAALTAGLEGAHGEDGCLAYALHRDLDEPTRFVVVERWRDQEALDSHAREPHLREMLAKVGALIAAPPSILRVAPVPAGDAAKGTLSGG
jgi:quinol monooxygenase YgiN